MGKKTIIPIGGTGYRFTTGSLSLNSGAQQAIVFDSNIINVWIRYTDASGYKGDMYYIEPNGSFWKTSGVSLNLYTSPFMGYIYNYARSLTATRVSNDTFNLYNNSSGTVTVNYIAMLESDGEAKSLFLLNGTILYTDGTVTTDVEGAIQTIDTNKYKIKANALVNIAGASYVQISN